MRPHSSSCNFAAPIALFCMLFILGCGGSGSSSSKVSSSTPPPAPTFTLSAGAPKVSLSAGGSPVTVSLAITGSAGFAGTVQVVATGVPAGVTVSPVSISGAPNGTASVSITASSSTAPGTYTLTFTATDSTQQTQSVTVSLTIAAAAAPPPPSPSYSLSITGPPQLPQGGTATATLTATYVGGFDGSVSVAPVFLPTGVSITSGPIVFTAQNLSQTVTFAASSSTVTATYPIVFTGTGGDVACADGLLFFDSNSSSPSAIGLCLHHYAGRHQCVCFSRSGGTAKYHPGLPLPGDRQLDRECRRPKLRRSWWFATISRQLRRNQPLHLFDRI